MTLHALSSAVQYVAYRRGHDDPPRPRHGVLRLGRRRGYLVGSGARRRLRRFRIAAVTVAVAGVMVIIMPLGSHVDGSLDQREILFLDYARTYTLGRGLRTTGV